MVWKTCHAERLALNVLGAITPGECDAKYFGSFFRIIAVCLIEITTAEQQYGIRVLGFEVVELFKHGREAGSSHRLGLCLCRFFLGFFYLLLFLLGILLLLIFLLNRLLSDILSLCLLLGLVCTYSDSICATLTQNICKETGSKKLLVVLHVIRKPKALPLRGGDLTRFELLSVYRRQAEDNTGLCLGSLGLEDVDSLNLVEFFGSRIALENVNPLFGLLCGGKVVFLRHILTHRLCHFLVTLLHGREKEVDICFVRIDTETLLVLWLHVECPLAVIVPHHENPLEVNGTRTLDGIRHVEKGDGV